MIRFVELRTAAILLGMVSFLHPAMAADVGKITTVDGLAGILISGTLTAGDDETFRKLAVQYPEAVVFLESPGGALIPSLEIGRLISLRNYPTVVIKGAVCASSCALIWLAGKPRLLDTGARVGFHASYRDEGGKQVETGVGNAIVGHYLSQLNLPERAVIFATKASPSQITWLDASNQVDSGIDFEEPVKVAEPSPVAFERKAYGQSVSIAPQAVAIPQVATANAVLRAGTPVSFKLMEEITTKEKSARVGQRFQLEVVAPVEINGVTVIPSGTPAWGEITGVRDKGMWGKSGKLDAQLLFLRINGRQIRLSGTFDDKGVTGTAGVVGAVVLIPLAGFFMTGTSAMLPKGGPVNGFIDEDVELAFTDAAKRPMQVPVAQPAMEVNVVPKEGN